LKDELRGSSPRTRGPSRILTVHRHIHELIPEHAGIFPCAPRDSVPSCARPRARGGLPLHGDDWRLTRSSAHDGIDYGPCPRMTFQRLTLTSAVSTDGDNLGCLAWDVSHLD
jgi:hypothetical protein